MGSGSHVEHEAGTSIKPKKPKVEDDIKPGTGGILDFGMDAEEERPVTASSHSASKSLRT